MTKALVEYLGFSDTDGSREYRLRSRSGGQTQDYTVGIAHAAFASGAARYQDGPQICYQRIERELEAAAEPPQHRFDMSTAELATYQALHPAPPSRKGSPRPAAPPPPAAAEAPKPEVNER